VVSQQAGCRGTTTGWSGGPRVLREKLSQRAQSTQRGLMGNRYWLIVGTSQQSEVSGRQSVGSGRRSVVRGRDELLGCSFVQSTINHEPLTNPASAATRIREKPQYRTTTLPPYCPSQVPLPRTSPSDEPEQPANSLTGHPDRLPRCSGASAPHFQSLALFWKQLPNPPRSLSGPGTPDCPRGGLGTFCARTSKAWNFSEKNFQTLELFVTKSPKLGTFQARNFQSLELFRPETSKAWNFSGPNFQSLELFAAKLPKPGTFHTRDFQTLEVFR